MGSMAIGHLRGLICDCRYRFYICLCIHFCIHGLGFGTDENVSSLQDLKDRAVIAFARTDLLVKSSMAHAKEMPAFESYHRPAGLLRQQYGYGFRRGDFGPLLLSCYAIRKAPPATVVGRHMNELV